MAAAGRCEPGEHPGHEAEGAVSRVLKATWSKLSVDLRPQSALGCCVNTLGG